MSGMVVACAAYADGRRVADVSIEELDRWLDREGQFVWVGLNEPSEECLVQIQGRLGLHDLAVEDAHRAHQRPKAEEYGDSLFVVLRTAERAGDTATAFGETHVFVGPRYVVAIRHGSTQPYTEVRTRCESAPQLLRQGPGFVLYALMDCVVDRYFPVVDGLEDQLGALEDEIFEGRAGRDATERIYGLKRELIGVKRGIAPMIEVCNRLARFNVALIPDETRLYIRDVYDHALRINESIDNQRELLTSALEANLSLISVRQNDIMKQLAAWAAILAVPTLLAGVWGMNFKSMPELEVAYGYPIAVGLMLTTCGFLWSRFRRAGWL
jgi:magnesium transporter